MRPARRSPPFPVRVDAVALRIGLGPLFEQGRHDASPFQKATIPQEQNMRPILEAHRQDRLEVVERTEHPLPERRHDEIRNSEFLVREIQRLVESARHACQIPLVQANLVIAVMVNVQQVVSALADETLVYEVRPAAVSVPMLMYHNAGNLGRVHTARRSRACSHFGFVPLPEKFAARRYGGSRRRSDNDATQW